MRSPGFMALLFVASCSDPVHDDAVLALGPEALGVPPGPGHRPGQPCSECHDGRGPGNLVFSLAGTVYRSPGSRIPLPGAIVRFVDSALQTRQAATNCAGNFFVLEDDFEPAWPVWTKVHFAGIEQPMGSPIFRERSCAKCHADPAGPTSAGPVHLVPDDFPLPPSTCP